MAYIVPNSTIKFLTSVRLNSNRQDTIYFATLADQTNYFYNKQGPVYTDYYYVRETGKLRIKVNPNDASYRRLTSCVYMMYKNTDFEDKWYYAFVTEVNEYINNETMEISFELDPMQSFMFEPDGSPCYVPLACMIERQTPVQDKAPILNHYMINESFDTGEYLFVGDDEEHFDYISVDNQGVVSLSDNASLAVDFGNGIGNMLDWGDYNGHPTWYPVLFTTMNKLGDNVHTDGVYVGGAYSGLNCYIFTTATACNNFLNQIAGSGLADQVVSMSMWPAAAVGALLRQHVGSQGGQPCTDLSGAAIAYLSQASSGSIVLTDINLHNGRYVKKTIKIPVPTITRTAEGKFRLYFAGWSGMSEYEYIEANNLKCFMSQFFGLYISNGQGTIETYQLEYWTPSQDSSNRNNYDIDFYFIPTASANALLAPNGYKGNSRQYNMGLQNFPQCAFTSSTYRQWLARNEPILSYERTATEKQNDLSMQQAQNDYAGAKGAYALAGKQAELSAAQEQRRVSGIGGAISGGLDVIGSRLGEVPGIGTIIGQHQTQAEINSQQIDLQIAQAQKARAGAERSLGMTQAQANANTQLLNAKQKAQKSVASMSSPAYHGNTQSGAELLSEDMRFHIGYYVSPQEYINKADAYYDLYGYEVDEIAVPNITAGNYWTYVKTNGFSARNDAVPDVYMKEIAALFDGGIRFWKNGDDIGNYRPGNNNYTLT